MPLVVEDGSGKVDADSYDSTAGIIATLTKYGDHVTFAGKTGTEQEQIARKGTRKLDTEESFRGRKKTLEQALEWPREDAQDDDGYTYPSDEIPARLKEALAYYCKEIADGGDIQPNVSSPGTIKAESVKVGPIEESIEYMGGKEQETFYRKVEYLLSELVEPTSVLERA